jgi:hypothetical protein
MKLRSVLGLCAATLGLSVLPQIHAITASTPPPVIVLSAHRKGGGASTHYRPGKRPYGGKNRAQRARLNVAFFA